MWKMDVKYLSMVTKASFSNRSQLAMNAQGEWRPGGESVWEELAGKARRLTHPLSHCLT